MRLAIKQRARVLFFTGQTLYRNYPPPFRQFERYNYQHAAAALAGNRDAADVLRRKGYQGSIHILPQFGFDTDIYKRSVAFPSRKPGDVFTIGFIGRLKEEKGLSLIVEALTYLPANCRAVFIGHGPMKSVLEEQALRLGVMDRVLIKPSIPTSEVPREIEQWDAHILPSITRSNWIDQFGRTLAEAMSCEVPVVGSSSGEIPHVIGDAGLVFKEGNARDLSECIRKLMDDPVLYEDLARRGRQRVLDNYTQERIAQKTYEIYQEVLSEQLTLKA